MSEKQPEGELRLTSAQVNAKASMECLAEYTTAQYSNVITQFFWEN